MTAQGVLSSEYFEASDCTTPIALPVEEVPAPDSLADVVAAVQEGNNGAVTPTPLLTPVTAQDCAGGALTENVNQAVLTIPHPNAVQKVQICNATPEFLRTEAVLCDPAGANVLVITIWPENAAPGTPPVVEAYNQDGTPYGGAIADLVKCPGEKFDIVQDDACAAQVGYTRVSFFDVTAQPPTLVATLWRDASGAVVPEPAGVTIGECVALMQDRKVLVWHESITSVRTIQDIVISTGIQHVQSLTAVNVGQQTAAITDDFGNTTKLFPGQSWSWSAITGQDAWDTLGYSSLSIDATGTDVHITSTVIS